MTHIHTTQKYRNPHNFMDAFKGTQRQGSELSEQCLEPTHHLEDPQDNLQYPLEDLQGQLQGHFQDHLHDHFHPTFMRLEISLGIKPDPASPSPL